MKRFRILIIFLAALFFSAPAIAQEPPSLEGVWGTQLRLGPDLRGPLLVRRAGGRWIASVGKETTVFAARESDLRFAFGRRGGFRGQLEDNRIVGFWMQPAGNSPEQEDMGGASQPFATPINLSQVGPNRWRGTIRPLDVQFTLWLSIFRAANGSLMAAFRNPELNSNGGASRFRVIQEGDRLRFQFKEDEFDIRHDGQWLHSPDRIRLQWPDVHRTLELTRRRGSAAAAFFPRPPGSAPYVYRRPPQLAGGWRTASAASTGIDEAVLQSLVRGIAGSDPTARPPTLMHSILVAHRGRLVLEEYFYGFARSTVHDIRSAGKTFGSVLLGTAPARRAGLAPDSRIYERLRGLGPFANPDPRKARITLADLMTHTSGLACNDNDDKSPGNESTMQMQKAEPNWWRYTLNLPMAHVPGVRYAYCSANSNLIGGALTQATGTWLPELFRRTIAEPLQFGEWHWNLMDNGDGYLGGGAFLRPRDFLKVGQVYLDGGVWNGRRIVPADWVRVSTRPVIEISPETTGLSAEDFSNFYGRGKDALAWHTGSVTSGGRTYAFYSAGGNGGQLLVVVPDADLAVVFTGGNYGQGGVWTRWPQLFIGDRIIPAIRGGK